MTDVLKITSKGRVRILTLNRPDQLNSMNDALYEGCAAALHEAGEDDGVACVIITGEGRAFCAGQDLREMEKSPVYTDGKTHGFRVFREGLEVFPKPLIAAVNGLGVGIGLTMLPYCERVVMDEKARLRAPFATLGVTVEAGNSYLLPAMIGWAEASRILFTAEWVPADRALEICLAHEVAPAGEALAQAEAFAAKIAPMPVASLVVTKKLMQAARNDMVRAAHNREQVAFEELGRGPANREALAAFREKRDADFSGL